MDQRPAIRQQSGCPCDLVPLPCSRWGMTQAEPVPVSSMSVAPEVTLAEAAALVRAGFKLFDRWQLTSAEARALLGHPS